MFFVRFGKINILSQEGSTVTSLLAGENFGGFEFLFECLFEHTYKTGTFTELLVLDRSRFNEVLSNPRFQDLKDSIATTVDGLKEFMSPGILNLGVGKFTRTRSKSMRKGGKGGEEDADGDENDDEADSADGSRSPLTSPESSQFPTPSGTARTISESNLAKDPNDVFPKKLVDMLKKEVKELKDELSDSPLTRSGYHKGVAGTLVAWWVHRNSVNEQISIFSKNMGKKKKFMDMLSLDDDEDLILMPDYYVILEVRAYYCIQQQTYVLMSNSETTYNIVTCPPLLSLVAELEDKIRLGRSVFRARLLSVYHGPPAPVRGRRGSRLDDGLRGGTEPVGGLVL